MESTAIESGAERVPREREFRRRWYEAHHSRFVADERGNRQAKATSDEFHSSGAKALELLDELARTGDLESFKKGTQKWAPGHDDRIQGNDRSDDAEYPHQSC